MYLQDSDGHTLTTRIDIEDGTRREECSREEEAREVSRSFVVITNSRSNSTPFHSHIPSISSVLKGICVQLGYVGASEARKCNPSTNLRGRALTNWSHHVIQGL